VYLNKGLYGFDTTLDGQKLRQEIASCFVDHLDSLLKQRIDADQAAYLKNIGSYKTGSLSDFSGLNKYITKHHDTGDARKNCIALAGALVAESSHEVALTGIIERINQGFDLVMSARQQCVRQKVQECVITLVEKELAPESSLKAPVGSMSDVSNAFCSALREGEKRIASASASLQALRLMVKVPADAIGDSFSELFQQCEMMVIVPVLLASFRRPVWARIAAVFACVAMKLPFGSARQSGAAFAAPGHRHCSMSRFPRWIHVSSAFFLRFTVCRNQLICGDPS